MVITTGSAESPLLKDDDAADRKGQQKHQRKLLTRAIRAPSGQMDSSRRSRHRRQCSVAGGGAGGRPLSLLICILIFVIKIVTTTGNVIPNNGHQHRIIINDSNSSTSPVAVVGPAAVDGQQQELPNQEQQKPAAGIMSIVGGRGATYSYFYIGRKLIYVPLFFLLYWVVYNLWLLSQSIASRYVSADFSSSFAAFNWQLVANNILILVFIDRSTYLNIGRRHSMHRKRSGGEEEQPVIWIMGSGIRLEIM